METTLSSKILRVAAAAPIVLALAACSSNNTTPGTDAGSSTSATTTASTSPSSSGSASTGTSSSGTSSSSSSGAVTDAGADATTPTFANVYSDVLSHCVGCHGLVADGGPGLGITGGKLDMGDAAAAWSNLVGADGGGVVAQGIVAGYAGIECTTLGSDAGLKRVMPGDFSKSLLCNKLASNDGDGGSIPLSDGGTEVFCGSPMPLHFPSVGPAAVTEIKEWIEAGAKP